MAISSYLDEVRNPQTPTLTRRGAAPSGCSGALVQRVLYSSIPHMDKGQYTSQSAGNRHGCAALTLSTLITTTSASPRHPSASPPQTAHTSSKHRLRAHTSPLGHSPAAYHIHVHGSSGRVTSFSAGRGCLPNQEGAAFLTTSARGQISSPLVHER